MEHPFETHHASGQGTTAPLGKSLLLVIGPGCDHVQSIPGMRECAHEKGLRIEIVGDGRQEVTPAAIEKSYLELPEHTPIVMTAKGSRNKQTTSIMLSNANAWSSTSKSMASATSQVETRCVLTKLLKLQPRFIVLTAGALGEYADVLTASTGTQAIFLLDGGPESPWNTGEGRTKMITQCIIAEDSLETLAVHLLQSPYDLNALVPAEPHWTSYFSAAPKYKVDDYVHERYATSAMHILLSKKRLEEVSLTGSQSIELAKVFIHRLAVTDQDAQINLWIGILKRLMKADVVACSMEGSASPLSVAIASGSMAAAKLLLVNKIDLNHQSNDFDTPLLAAIRNAEGELHSQLVDFACKLIDTPEVDVNMAAAAQRPLTLAIEKGRDTIVTRLLARKDIRLGIDQNEALRKAIVHKNIFALKALIKAGVDVNAEFAHNTTPLRLAIDQVFCQGVKDLISDRNTSLERKIPLLAIALQKNDLQLMQAVIDGRRLRLRETERNSLELTLKDRNIRKDCIDALNHLL